MPNTVVSVIIPVYNASSYLQECLESVLSQSLADFEIILVDDGSTDNSGLICDEYAKKDNRVKVFHKENEGVCVARNIGLDNAKGDWIAFVDSDDLLLPDALRKMYNAAVLNEVNCVLAGSMVLNNGEKKVLKQFQEKKFDDAVSNAPHPALWGYLFKASIIHQNRIRFIPGLSYSEDRVFICQYTIFCRNILHLADIVYVYRVSSTSACGGTDGLRKAESQFWAASEIVKICRENSLTSVQNNWLNGVKEQLLRLGYKSYVSRSFSPFTYRRYEQLYLKFFNGRIRLFFRTILSFLTCQRRKFIVFSYNPGSRQKSKFKIK